jgi:hypothetical protein
MGFSSNRQPRFCFVFGIQPFSTLLSPVTFQDDRRLWGAKRSQKFP